MTGQRLESGRAVLACRVLEPDHASTSLSPGSPKTRSGANTASDPVLAEGNRILIDDEGGFDGVAVIGIDEHVCHHTRRGDKYVTVIIDLAAEAGTGRKAT